VEDTTSVDDSVPVMPSPQPADEQPESAPDGDDYYYYYYYDVETTELPAEEKENAIKEIATKIGTKMHGRCRAHWRRPMVNSFKALTQWRIYDFGKGGRTFER